MCKQMIQTSTNAHGNSANGNGPNKFHVCITLLSSLRSFISHSLHPADVFFHNNNNNNNNGNFSTAFLVLTKKKKKKNHNQYNLKQEIKCVII